MGLIGLAIHLVSELGNKNNSHQLQDPAYNAPAGQYYTTPYSTPQPRPMYISGHQMKRERKAEKKLIRAEVRAERAAIKAHYVGRRGGCCGSSRAYAPPMQINGVGNSAGFQGGYVDERRREYVEIPTRGFVEKERSHGGYVELHQSQQRGIENVPVRNEDKPPAYEDAI